MKKLLFVRRAPWQLHRVVPLSRRSRRDVRRPLGPAGRRDQCARHRGHRAARTRSRRGRRPCTCTRPRDCPPTSTSPRHHEVLRYGVGGPARRPATWRPRFVVSAQNCWNDPVVAADGRRRSRGRTRDVEDRRGAVETRARSSAVPSACLPRVTTSSAPGSTTGAISTRVKELAEISGGRRGPGHRQPLGRALVEALLQCHGEPRAGPCPASAPPRSWRMPSGRRRHPFSLAAESARVRLALGFRVPKIGAFPAEPGRHRSPRRLCRLDKKITPALGPGRNWQSSMGQDVDEAPAARRSKQMNGHVVTKGQRPASRPRVRHHGRHRARHRRRRSRASARYD